MPLIFDIEHVDSVIKSPTYAESYHWNNFLKLITIVENQSDLPLKCPEKAVPVSVFRDHVLREYIEHIASSPVLMLVEVKDYKRVIDPRIRIMWLATVKKIVGYRVLMRWVGATSDDFEHDFFVNIGAKNVQGLSHSEIDDGDVCIPPAFLESRWRREETFEQKLSEAMKGIQEYKTIHDDFFYERDKINQQCCLKVGQRLELLDYSVSSRVRPARIKAVIGRRVNVVVMKNDCDTQEEDDRQYGAENDFWVDHSSFFLFPVGWAARNGYEIAAKPDYIRHAQNIADAHKNGSQPQYHPNDVTPGQLTEWKKYSDEDSSEWKQGMKFELMDPLGSTVRDLHVATVLEVLTDGYLKIGIDGPDMETDCIPLHCTSPLMFPVGYAKKHGLVLNDPKEEDDFDWKKYLAQTKSIAAPENFFKANPSSERLAEFKVGAKLEVSDMVENLLVCPATVVGIKGRLIMVHFDGWENGYDQYFDIDSKDLMPLGWCEMHGFKLEKPKGYVEEGEPARKKAKK